MVVSGDTESVRPIISRFVDAFGAPSVDGIRSLVEDESKLEEQPPYKPTSRLSVIVSGRFRVVWVPIAAVALPVVVWGLVALYQHNPLNNYVNEIAYSYIASLTLMVSVFNRSH